MEFFLWAVPPVLHFCQYVNELEHLSIFQPHEILHQIQKLQVLNGQGVFCVLITD